MNKYKGLVIVCLFLIEICSLFLTYKSFSNRPLKEVKETNKVDNKKFSMYIENNNGDYEEYTTSEFFPSKTFYSFNSEESNCIDNKGNVVNNALSYEDSKVTVTSNKTLYCYLYFDKNIYDIETDILVKNEEGKYESVSSTPTTDNNYNYNVRYDCSDNASIVSFGYDYETHNYNLITSAKNKCNIYFEEMEPDLELNIYVDNNEVEEIPTGNYKLNETKSSCTDSNAIIKYYDDTNEVEIYTSGITTCDVYLETREVTTGEVLLANPTTGLDATTAYSGLYRYIGTEANNYVKIGDILYRIIGIVSENNELLGLEEGQLKVIKSSNIGTHVWHSSASLNATWDTGGTDSSMYTYLQSSSVLGNINVVPNVWVNKIDSVKWYVGDVQSWTNATVIANLENKQVTVNTSRIGLMYLSDYYYSHIGGGGTDCKSSVCTNWLNDKSSQIWTMTRYGYWAENGQYYGWYVDKLGAAAWNALLTDNITSARPVFYLNKDVYITNTEATGSSTDPFILSY